MPSPARPGDKVGRARYGGAMDAVVECGCCHRQERWTEVDGVRHVDVVVDGGVRRPSGDPRRGRLLAALDGVADPARHVVGACPACGQLLLSTEAALPAVPVREETPAGPLSVADGAIVGPAGPLDVEAARAFVAAAWRADDVREQVVALAQAPLLLPMLVLVVGWIAAIVFVIVFLSSIARGPLVP